MFFLKKLLRSLVLPPGAFIALFAIWGAVLLWRRKRSGWLPLGAALGMYLLSVGIVADPLLRAVEVRSWDWKAVESADVIVLLGGGIVEGAPGLNGVSAPGADMMCRVVDTVRLHRRLGKPVIVAGGAPGDGPSEAMVVRRSLVEFGIPDGEIFTDEASRDTVENAENVARIMRAHGYRSALVVTSAHHLRRALLLFRAAGVRGTGYPSNVIAETRESVEALDFLPSVESFRKTSIALRELLGWAFYELKY